MTLRGRVALVTGAASGIGRAVCRELNREGVVLGLLDRDADGLSVVASELPSCAWTVADVTDRAAIRTAIQDVAARLGPIDILVASAGITGATFVDDLAVEETEALLSVNVLGVANCIEVVLPTMLERRSGHVVGLASLAGCRGMPFSAAYSASKAALINYLESLRPALRKRGVAVTTVLPGFVRTPLMDRAKVRPPVRYMEAEEAARHVVTAIRRRSRVYAFPWDVALGIRVLCWLPPWLYDRCITQAVAKQMAELPY